MAFANGAPLIGATNEKPRLVEQPGFSSVYLRDLILSNRDISEIACGDEIQPIPPSAMMLIHSQTGLCSHSYVFRCAATTKTSGRFLRRQMIDEEGAKGFVLAVGRTGRFEEGLGEIC